MSSPLPNENTITSRVPVNNSVMGTSFKTQVVAQDIVMILG